MQLKYWVVCFWVETVEYFDVQHTISAFADGQQGRGKQEDAGRKLITSHTMH